MFKWIEFSNTAAALLVNAEGTESMDKLVRITTARASTLAKAICLPRGGAGVGTHVTEGASPTTPHTCLGH